MTDEQPFAAIGARLQLARKARAMSQGELAEAIGVNRQTIVLWERGASEPGAVKLLRVAESLGTSIDWLLTGAGDGPESTQRSALRAMIRAIERKIEALDAAR